MAVAPTSQLITWDAVVHVLVSPLNPHFALHFYGEVGKDSSMASLQLELYIRIRVFLGAALAWIWMEDVKQRLSSMVVANASTPTLLSVRTAGPSFTGQGGCLRQQQRWASQ